MAIEHALSVFFGMVTGIASIGTIIAYQANAIFNSTFGAIITTIFAFLSLAVIVSE